MPCLVGYDPRNSYIPTWFVEKCENSVSCLGQLLII